MAVYVWAILSLNWYAELIVHSLYVNRKPDYFSLCYTFCDGLGAAQRTAWDFWVLVRIFRTRFDNLDTQTSHYHQRCHRHHSAFEFSVISWKSATRTPVVLNAVGDFSCTSCVFRMWTCTCASLVTIGRPTAGPSSYCKVRAYFKLTTDRNLFSTHTDRKNNQLHCC